MDEAALFQKLTEDLSAWVYSLEVWFCARCSMQAETWHVLLVGQNSWNDEPWGQKYSFGSQAAAWQAAKELGELWMA